MTLHPDDVELAQEVMEGWGVASEGGITMALELALTPELRLEGLARELVRLAQDARKAAGLDVSDRIVLGFQTQGELTSALEAHAHYIAKETLATDMVLGDVDEATHRQEASIEGAAVSLSLRKA